MIAIVQRDMAGWRAGLGSTPRLASPPAWHAEWLSGPTRLTVFVRQGVPSEAIKTGSYQQ